MNLLLTDRLTCPRCGPKFGLILLAHRVEDRVVHEGVLGCPNCRDSFQVARGFADLRAPPRGPLGPGLAGAPPGAHEVGVEARRGTGGDGGAGAAGSGAPGTREGGSREAGASDSGRAQRTIALLGVLGGPGTLALVGEPARHAAAVAAVLGEIQVAAVDPDLAGWPESPRVSRLAASPGLPFVDAAMRGVAVDGRLGPSWLDEAVRVAAPRTRIVVFHAPAGAAARLEEAGAKVAAAEAETVVAARS